MTVKRGWWRTGRWWLLLAMLFITGLTVSGCVEGLQPVGWSGGAASGGTLYVGSAEGKLVAVNMADESRRWADELKPAEQAGGFFGCAPSYGGGCGGGALGVAIYGTPAVAEDLVYIGGYNGKVYAYNTSSLATRWVYPREGNLEPIVGGLVVAQDKVFFGDSAGRFYALDAATGDKLWELETGAEYPEDPFCVEIQDSVPPGELTTPGDYGFAVVVLESKHLTRSQLEKAQAGRGKGVLLAQTEFHLE